MNGSSRPAHYDVAIIGAGAAGLACALYAGRRGKRVIVLDHAAEAGAKILISGGGRCNFTNTGTASDRFFSDNPDFCRSALARYTPPDFLALVKAHGIAYHEKTLGQLFCDGSARQIVAMLLQECAAGDVTLRLSHRVTTLERADRFRIGTDGAPVEASALVLATGGPSIPKMGASGFAYDVARRFGLRVTETSPALVPLAFEGAMLDTMRGLAGVATEVVARLGRHSFREAALFTHRGLSGPAILQISTAWRTGDTIMLDLLPGRDAKAVLREGKARRPKAGLRTLLAEMLPQRLAAALTPDTDARPLAETPDRILDALAQRLGRFAVTPSGSEGYAKAEVTRGGIDTRDLSSRDMQARTVPGLFVIGEAVDVTGWLGGYNFQWAWASGWCAAQAL